MGNYLWTYPKIDGDLSKVNPKDIPCLPWLNRNVHVYVYSVTDGDTLKVLMEYKDEIFKFDILLDGIDTPEIIRCSSLEKEAGLKVKEYVQKLVEGKTVIFHGKRLDKFGNRIYGDVLLLNDELSNHKSPSGTNNKTNIGTHLLRKGYANFYDGKTKEKWSAEELNKILKKLIQ